MIKIFKLLWNFTPEEQANYKKALLFTFLYAIFNMLQFIAIFITLNCLFLSSVTTSSIVLVSAIMLISAIGKIACLCTYQMAETHAGYFAAAHKRIAIGEKIKRMPMGYFDDMSLGKLTTIATTTLSQLEAWIPILLVLMLGGFSVSAVFILSLFGLSTKIGLIGVAGAIGFMIVVSQLEKSSRKHGGDIQKVIEDLTKESITMISGMETIKAFNLKTEKNKEFISAIKNSTKVLWNLEKSVSNYVVAQRVVLDIATVGIIYAAACGFIDNSLNIAEAIMGFIASFVIFEGLSSGGSNMGILRGCETAILAVEEVENLPEIKEGTINTFNTQDASIEMSHVSFGYGKELLLKDINLTIPKNSMTAIIGPSGSGKSTLCHLIPRFWDVNSGEIIVANRKAEDYKLDCLMGNISMVFQNVYLFEDTIENNIAFGTPDATHEQVVAAAKSACAHEFIETLPCGYDTVIGEGGASLSGGEKQRISIARALMKDSPIIIFDEATANVDPENEDKLQKAMEALTENKTVIMIAHRLKTIRKADQILVLRDGVIEDRGTHDELIRRDGTYKDFIEAKEKSANWKLGA